MFRPKEEYKLYTYWEAQAVGALFVDYHWLHGYARQMEAKAGLYEQQIKVLDRELAIYHDHIERSDKSFKKMNALLEMEQKNSAHEAKVKRQAIIVLGLTAAVGILAAAVLGGFYGAEKLRH